jgi:hypothetical protein
MFLFISMSKPVSGKPSLIFSGNWDYFLVGEDNYSLSSYDKVKNVSCTVVDVLYVSVFFVPPDLFINFSDTVSIHSSVLIKVSCLNMSMKNFAHNFYSSSNQVYRERLCAKFL